MATLGDRAAPPEQRRALRRVISRAVFGQELGMCVGSTNHGPDALAAWSANGFRPNWKNRLLKSASQTPKPAAHGGRCIAIRPATICSLNVALTVIVGLPSVNSGPTAERPL